MDHLEQVTAFRHALAETIAWCTTRATIADPEWCLRTPALEPGHLDADLSVSQRLECVAGLVQARSRLLQNAGVYALTPATDLAGGRLLLFDPDGTLSDGGAAVGSRRFFDDDNVPPWDCWVLYVSDPLTPEQEAAEESLGRRTGRWSHVPPTPFPDAIPDEAGPVFGPPYYVVDPLHPSRQSYLVSWVAPALIPLVHDGVIVNPESCIEWLADRDTPFTHALQALHVLV
jgi:hypothetical protein